MPSGLGLLEGGGGGFFGITPDGFPQFAERGGYEIHLIDCEKVVLSRSDERHVSSPLNARSFISACGAGPHPAAL
jgi:hypothetical protein